MSHALISSPLHKNSRLDRRPWFAVEAKLTATTIDPSLIYFRNRLRIPWVYQVVLEGKRDFVQNGI
jgi:hypothetical protein